MSQQNPTSAKEVKSAALGNGNEINDFKHVAKRGALWVTLTSAATIPLSYYRNWLLSQFDTSGEVIGYYALISIFIGVVTTFVMYGGSSVITNYIPKIKRHENKVGFLFAYALISIFAVIVFVSLLEFFPSITYRLLGEEVDVAFFRMFLVLAPLVVLSQLMVFYLTGLMRFRLSSLLSRAQVLAVCLVATVGFFLFREQMTLHAFFVLSATVGLARILVTILGAHHIFRTLKPFTFSLYLPRTFWSFSSAIHLNTFVAFLCTKSDQIFVLSSLGVADLGGYFIIMQIAELVVFIPMRIGQVMLSSFSHLVASGNHSELLRAYSKICRFLLIITTPMSLAMIALSPRLLLFFNPRIAEMRVYFVLLILMFAIRGIGSVNTMLILAFDRGRVFLGNNLLMLAIQFAVTFTLLGRFGLLAIVIGRMSSSLIATIGNFAIVRWCLPEVRQRPPREYWLSVSVVAAASVYSIFLGAKHVLLDVGVVLLGLCLFMKAANVSVSEILTQLQGFRGSNANKY